MFSAENPTCSTAAALHSHGGPKGFLLETCQLSPVAPLAPQRFRGEFFLLLLFFLHEMGAFKESFSKCECTKKFIIILMWTVWANYIRAIKKIRNTILVYGCNLGSCNYALRSKCFLTFIQQNSGMTFTLIRIAIL